MENLRKKDYIIAFIILLMIMVFNIVPGDVLNVLVAIIKSIFTSAIGALVIGTFTNFIFRKKT